MYLIRSRYEAYVIRSLRIVRDVNVRQTSCSGYMRVRTVRVNVDVVTV